MKIKNIFVTINHNGGFGIIEEIVKKSDNQYPKMKNRYLNNCLMIVIRIEDHSYSKELILDIKILNSFALVFTRRSGLLNFNHNK